MCRVLVLWIVVILSTGDVGCACHLRKVDVKIGVSPPPPVITDYDLVELDAPSDSGTGEFGAHPVLAVRSF